jgi:hypothetical protein
MPKNADKRILLAKIEATEGTDSAPTAAANAFVTVGLDATGLDADTKVRNTDGQYFGARPSVLAQVRRPVRFNVEIAGSGVSAITPPAWMALNRVCGFNAGVAGASSVVQSPITDAIPSMTLWPFYDNLRVAALGSRGNLTLTFEDDEIPLFGYDMMGFPPAGLVAEAAPGAPTFANQAAPLIVSTQNTTFSLGGYAAPLRRLSINLGNRIEPRSLVGPVDRAVLRNREATFEAVIELPDLGTKNYFTNLENRATQALQLVHGIAAGNIVEVAGPRAEIGAITLSEEAGVMMATVPGRLLPSAASGNDELTITSK